MKVLYVLDGYPSLSESYIRTEIDWARARNVEVAVYAREEVQEGSYESPVPVEYGDEPERFVKSWGPHVVHHHYLESAVLNAPRIGAALPVTVRGHSVEHSQKLMERVLALRQVKRIFLFPAFSEKWVGTTDRVVPVTVAYDPEIFHPTVPKDWNLVVRAGTGKQGKDLEGFIRTAALLKGRFRFVLAVSRVQASHDYVAQLHALNNFLGNPAEILVNVPRKEVAHLMATAGFCLRGFDTKSHAYGMPQSIAEAMGSGCTCLLPDVKEARDYGGSAPLYYRDQKDAARLLEASTSWTMSDRGEMMRGSLERARTFSAPAALAPVFDAWRALAGVSA